jgi:glycosyltransferase involved in cell wall biosynthesis
VARAVLAAPLHNGGRFVEPAVRSLLSQTYDDYALLLVDDASTDETPAVARRLAAASDRAVYFRSDKRLGMVANWRRCVELARKRHPEAEFFAWGSDHDLWETEWLATLVAAFEADPGAVVCYPRNDRIDEAGDVVRRPSRLHARVGRTAAARVWQTTQGIAAGSSVYGLYRLDALEAAGIFRRVLAPDRLVLTELAFQGKLVQVDRVLWHRRTLGRPSKERQRATLFGGAAPSYAHLPPNLTHVAVLLWMYVIRGEGRPRTGRAQALWLTCVHSVGSLVNVLRRRRSLASIRRGIRRSIAWGRAELRRTRRMLTP